MPWTMLGSFALSLLMNPHGGSERTQFEHFLGMQIGADSVDKLEHALGKGVVRVGTHSNSGRSWHFPRCNIVVDAGERFGDRNIIDYVSLDWKGTLNKNDPFKSGHHWSLGWIQYGQRIDVCADKLRHLGFSPIVSTDGIICRCKKELFFKSRRFSATYTLEFTGHTRLNGLIITVDYPKISY